MLFAAAAVPATGLRAEPGSCDKPAEIGDGRQIAPSVESGFDASALCALASDVARSSTNIHALLIERHDRLVTELYRQGQDRSIYSLFARDVSFGPASLHDMRSVSKSVVGLLVGRAMQEGKLGALTTPVLDLYPELADLRGSARDRITLEHLLTMTSGLEWNESIGSYGSLANDETRLYWDWNPVRFVLGRQVVTVPGTRFNYNGGGTAVLADTLQRATQQGLRELARAWLFEPLGIKEWEWVGDVYRRPLAFAGLRMRPRDLLKIGRMLLSRGRFDAKQIVAPEWIDASFRAHIAASNGFQYGYHWWAGSVDRGSAKLAWSAAFGNGGQRLYVVPALDMAVVITAGTYNDAGIAQVTDELLRRIIAAVQDEQVD